MEIQEQQFVRELAESRMQIELLRNRVLLRYYAQLLELDIMEQTQEVKALMSSINTLERYARKYEPKESAGGSGEVCRNKEGEPDRIDVLSGKTMPCVSARSGVENMTAVPSRSVAVRNLPNGLKIESVTTRGKSHRK